MKDSARPRDAPHRATLLGFVLAAVVWSSPAAGAAQTGGAPEEPSFEQLEQRLARLEGEARLAALVEIVERFFERMPGPAFAYGEEALRLLEERHDEAGQAQLLVRLSRMQYSRSEFTSALDYASRGRALADSISDRRLAAEALRRTADANLALSRYELAMESLEASRQICDEIGDGPGLAETLKIEGAAHQMQGRYAEAVGVYLEALPLFESANNVDGMARIHNNVGLIHFELGQMDQAREYWERALSLARELDNDVLVAGFLNNLGMAERESGNYERARELYLESLALNERTGSQRIQANTLNNLGEVHKDQGLYDASLTYHLRSLALRREIGDQKGTARSLGATGVLYARMGDQERAYSYLTQALELAESLGLRYEMSEARKELAGVHAARGDFRTAYEELRRHEELSGELASRGTLERLVRLRTFYETERQSREIQILRQKQDIQELALSRQRLRQNALVLVSLLLLGTATHLYTRYRARNRLLDTERANHQREAAAQAERERIEKAMLRAQKLESLGVLAGGIAHDFNNLLTTILGNANLALQETSKGSPTRESLEMIHAASTRAAELTDQMLAYSGGGAFVLGPIDLSQLVRETLTLIESSISKKAELRLELEEGLPQLRADRAQMQQIVVNLLTNASDALNDAPGTIVVRTGVVPATYAAAGRGLDGPRVFLEVRDEGAGMDEATKARIFDPFFSTKAEGRGLGLAAVEGIVRSHGGQITVESAPGEGASLRIVLEAESEEPAAEEVAGPAEDHREAAGEAGVATILVVDDEEGVRHLAGRALAKQGWRVLMCADGEEGVRAFRKHARDIDAVLLDLSMPKRDGAEVFEIVRGLKPRLPVVLTSGYNQSEVARKLGGRRHVAFLKKPFGVDELVGLLRSELSLGEDAAKGSEASSIR